MLDHAVAEVGFSRSVAVWRHRAGIALLCALGFALPIALGAALRPSLNYRAESFTYGCDGGGGEIRFYLFGGEVRGGPNGPMEVPGLLNSR